jgi:hypothetical protein
VFTIPNLFHDAAVSRVDVRVEVFVVSISIQIEPTQNKWPRRSKFRLQRNGYLPNQRSYYDGTSNRGDKIERIRCTSDSPVFVWMQD